MRQAFTAWFGRRAMPPRSTASSAKASAGALAHVRIATVVNIARAVEELKERWGVDDRAWRASAGALRRSGDLTLPTAIVLGAEGTGLRRLVRERCDRLVSIPMAGAVSSLNVSVAAGVMLFEAERQRGFGASIVQAAGPERPEV